MTDFAFSNPVFFGNDDEKSCFYINLYNSAILLKLANVSILEPRKTFEIRDWQVLEKSSTIILNGHLVTAFELRNNLKKLNPYNPFVDFALYIPNGISWQNLIFDSAEYFQSRLPLEVKKSIVEVVKISENKNLILLPKLFE